MIPANSSGLGVGAAVGSGRVSATLFDPLGEFDELGRTRRRMPFDPPSLGPRIGRVVVPDITEQQARGCPVDDQANIFADANRPEIRVARPVEPMKAQTRARQVQLKIKRRRLDRLLLRAVQPGEAGGEGIGDAEFHVAPSLTQNLGDTIDEPLGGVDRGARAVERHGRTRPQLVIGDVLQIVGLRQKAGEFAKLRFVLRQLGK